MAFSIEWLIPQRVFVLRVEGNVSRDDLQQMGNAVETAMDSGIAPVHMIMDTAKMNRFPLSVPKLLEFSQWLYHAHTGWLILLQPSQLVGFLGMIITGMAHVHLKTADTEAEALQLLHKEDATL